MFRNLFCVTLLFVIFASGPHGWTESTGITGNEAQPEGFYANWPGAARIVNCPSRVYLSWFNDSNSSYFRGDTATLNEAIARFIDIAMPADLYPTQSAVHSSPTDVPRHEVILRSGPATIKTIESTKLAFDWKLDIEHCVSRTPARKGSTSRVIEVYPVLTVYIGDGNINLNDVQIPEGVSLVQLADLRVRYLAGLKSADPTVRGIAADRLAALGASSAESIAPLAELLRDPEPWVQTAARLALRSMGKPARPILAKELERSDLKDEERKSLQEGIQFIDDTVVDTDAEAESNARSGEISAFVERQRIASKATGNQE